MEKETEKKTGKKFGKKGAAVTGGAAAVLALALLFGTGKLGFGSGTGLGDSPGSSGNEATAAVETEKAAVTEIATVTEPEVTPESTVVVSTVAVTETEAPRIEIRIQGREYNYLNVTYGNSEHPLSELLEVLKEFPPDTRIELMIEDNATKNAVDDLENALTAAGFQDIHK